MNRIKARFCSFVALLIILSCPFVANGQTTGKISGIVLDRATREPLPGANVIIEDTQIGAAAGMDGSFFILNIPPGSYTVKVRMMGYETLVLTNVRISVNRTFEIDARLNPTVIEGKEVVVTAEKLEIKKDQTSSVRNVSAEEIELLPVESIGAVVNMQAGVVAQVANIRVEILARPLAEGISGGAIPASFIHAQPVQEDHQRIGLR